ncbi:Glyoxalase-like domain-containing protein [Frankia sp. EI5c]|nr:Glyoxalase-like domain-containing protein [Frankia sp. EI5c]
MSEDEFDGAFARLCAAGVPYYADPQGAEPGRINRRDGGRGLYFRDPSGHVMEIITRPYGA